MLEQLLTVESLIAFLTLTALELVLGIDNIVVIAILTGRLPEEKRRSAQRLGLMGAMVTRIALLLCISWMMRLTEPVLTVLGHAFSGKDLILISGGLFLMGKATHEIHQKLEGGADHVPHTTAKAVGLVITQIMLLDIVFSLDSVITAIGMARHIPIMVAAIVTAVIVMMVFAAPVSAFVERHPTIKILALSFLILIGVVLTIEGMGKHIERGYIYFAMGFSLAVEMINLRIRERQIPAEA